MRTVLLVALMMSLSALAAGDKSKGAVLFKKCISCHGKDGMGKKSQNAPMIAGQYDWYIVSQVKAIQGKERWNENSKKMYPFVKKLEETEIQDLAAYISSMKLKK